MFCTTLLVLFIITGDEFHASAMCSVSERVGDISHIIPKVSQIVYYNKPF